tara:strand:+ start:1715 stop:2443 length:729 start_codon:yes stop_codon:yes gene_type:complete
MNFDDVKALTFDTGGTILDWRTGFIEALKNAGQRHGIDRDWNALAKEIRIDSLNRVRGQGETFPPQYNMDEAHRAVLDDVIQNHGLEAFTECDRHNIAYEAPHNFSCWPDFPSVLPKLRSRYICVSFTILSYRLIIDTARRNGLQWDAVFSCEGIGKYKGLPESYLTVASQLQLDPEQCCMVACHNNDLDAAKSQGFRTIYVRRPMEYDDDGATTDNSVPHADHDLVVDDFPGLAKALNVPV